MELPERRILNLLGFIACAGLMAYALISQYFLELAPCPLCVFQRIGVIAMGVVFLLAALHNAGRVGSLVYSVLLLLAAGGGGGVAARHIWLQNLPPDKVPACGPGLEFMLDQFPLGEALKMVFSGSGECADVIWSFLGLSMPTWVLISVVTLTIYGLYANLIAPRKS